jgi:hypothetical protein
MSLENLRCGASASFPNFSSCVSYLIYLFSSDSCTFNSRISHLSMFCFKLWVGQPRLNILPGGQDVERRCPHMFFSGANDGNFFHFAVSFILARETTQAPSARAIHSGRLEQKVTNVQRGRNNPLRRTSNFYVRLFS